MVSLLKENQKAKEMGANRRNKYIVSRRFSPAYLIWENKELQDQYYILLSAYLTSKQFCQDGKDGHQIHQQNIDKLSSFLNEH